MIVAQISTQDPEGPGILLIVIEANASDHGGALVALNAPRKNYVFQMEITFSMFAPKLRK